MKTNRIIITLICFMLGFAACAQTPSVSSNTGKQTLGRKRQTGTGRRNYCIRMWPYFAVFLYLCALELPPAAVLASAILYLEKNQLEIEYEF